MYPKSCHFSLSFAIKTIKFATKNSSFFKSGRLSASDSIDIDNDSSKTGFTYCSELIPWRVDPVGPLSKSGGIVELWLVDPVGPLS